MNNGGLKMGVLWDLTDFYSTLHLSRIASLNLVSLLLTDHIYWHAYRFFFQTCILHVYQLLSKDSYDTNITPFAK